MEVSTKDRLKQIMRERNLRQTDIFNLAQPFCQMYEERLGLADISAYVTGKYLPAQKKLNILAMALDVSEAWLMGLDVPMNRINTHAENSASTATQSNIIDQLTNEYRLDASERSILSRILKLPPDHRSNLLHAIMAISNELNYLSDVERQAEIDAEYDALMNRDDNESASRDA